MKVLTRLITTLGAGALLTGVAVTPALASTHTVVAGDTLSGIAAGAGVQLARVEAANPQITNPNFITVGELVNVPGGSAAVTSPPPASPVTTSAGSSGSAPSSFQQCVAWRESSDTATDPDGLYGILPSTWASLGYSGTAGAAPVAVQNQAFQRLYARDGSQPWAPYDGC